MIIIWHLWRQFREMRDAISFFVWRLSHLKTQPEGGVRLFKWRNLISPNYTQDKYVLCYWKTRQKQFSYGVFCLLIKEWTFSITLFTVYRVLSDIIHKLPAIDRNLFSEFRRVMCYQCKHINWVDAFRVCIHGASFGIINNNHRLKMMTIDVVRPLLCIW